MSNEEYFECIVRMLKQITDNKKLEKIFKFVHRLFI